MRHLALIAIVMTLAACGLKDDLYLPAPKSAATPAAEQPSTPAASPDSSEEEERTPASNPPTTN